jgi:hypothetical protein
MIRSNTAHSINQLNGQNPETVVSGETPDITTIVEFCWYEGVEFRDTAISFPNDPILLVRNLGLAIDIGPAYTRKIMKVNGQVIFRSTVRSLTSDELKSPDEEAARIVFNKAIQERLSDPTTWEDIEDDAKLDTPMLEGYQDPTGGTTVLRRDDEDAVEEATPDSFDRYVGAEVLLQTGDGNGMGRVKGRQRNSDGQVIGVANRNPVLDTRVYAIEFPDGKVGEYAANVIAENTFSLADPDGNQMLLLEAIVAHRKDGHAVEKADVFVFKNAQRSIRKTTEGWQLCVEWKNGSATRERLADVKESHPVEVAENAVAHDIQDKPAFAWWVPATIEIRNRIIAAVKLQIPRTNEKFGIQIRRSWAEAVKLDMDNGDDQWQKAI